MSDGPWTCQNGHVNPTVTAVCRECRAPNPGAPRAIRSTASRELLDAATSFDRFATIYTVLVVLCALVLAYLGSRGLVCDELGPCRTEVDGLEFAFLLAVFITIGMLFVLPLRGVSSILRGVARLVRDAERAD